MQAFTFFKSIRIMFDMQKHVSSTFTKRTLCEILVISYTNIRNNYIKQKFNIIRYLNKRRIH